MGRYVSQPLTVKCKSLEDLRRFLLSCKGVSDKEQFGKDDYWQLPEQFEKTKRGDCDDFALWAWRQLLEMGYEARFVAGTGDRYGYGHAWVQFYMDGTWYLLEPTLPGLGLRMPRFNTFRYHPRLSVGWNGTKLLYYQHQEVKPQLSLAHLARLLPEYIYIWGLFWLRSPKRLPRFLWYRLKRFFKGFRWMGKRADWHLT